jgi:hypothetical protein
VRLPGVALQQGRAGRLSRDDGDFGPRQANHVARAGDGPTGTVPADVIVQPPVGEILEDLRAGRVGVIGRIRLVFELLRHEPAVFGGQRLRDAHHPGGPLRGRREHDYERIAADGADHGQRDPGVARSGLDDGLPGLEQTLLFRVEDDAQRQPVLDRAHRVEGLDLDVHLDAIGRKTVDTDNGSAADRFEYVVVNHVSFLCSGRPRGGIVV